MRFLRHPPLLLWTVLCAGLAVLLSAAVLVNPESQDRALPAPSRPLAVTAELRASLVTVLHAHKADDSARRAATAAGMRDDAGALRADWPVQSPIGAAVRAVHDAAALVAQIPAGDDAEAAVRELELSVEQLTAAVLGSGGLNGSPAGPGGASPRPTADPAARPTQPSRRPSPAPPARPSTAPVATPLPATDRPDPAPRAGRPTASQAIEVDSF